ncbi:MAG TPA: hypothetical protein VM240_00770 [Verrucomicrobiae bacterium]|nr:hypothetical protein [Verrucomicrobiae bacterium]
MSKRMMAVVMAVAAMPAMAKDVEITPSCAGAACQAAFESVSEDIIATIDYQALGPAEATGIIGLGIGVVASYVPIDVDAHWQQVTGQDFSGLGLVGLQVTKGLPLDIDVGAFYTTVPGTNVDVYGGEVRYAILAGSTTSPALALRGSYVKVAGVESIALDSKSVDLSLSKGFGPITPYVGVGYVMGESDPDSSTLLSKVEVEETKAYIGTRISLGLVEFTPQVGQVGDNIVYGLRVGFSISL